MNPAAAMWENEITGMTLSACRTMFVYDEPLAYALAAEGISRGANIQDVFDGIGAMRKTYAAMLKEPEDASEQKPNT